MTTLHIEHAISDFATWHAAFQRFEEVRARSGVLRHHISRPVDDDCYVVVDLELGSREEAEAMLGFLRAQVWPSRTSAPALVGTPLTRILEPAPTT